MDLLIYRRSANGGFPRRPKTSMVEPDLRSKLRSARRSDPTAACQTRASSIQFLHLSGKTRSRMFHVESFLMKIRTFGPFFFFL